MPTVINTNLASLFAQNSLSSAQNNLAQSVQRLSSGLRINSAKDDAAGLSISQNMQSQINGTNQSIRNLSDATNLLQVADSSLATVQDMLLRLKQLATQGYDGSLSTSQKLNIVQEMKDLNAEINATASRTAFNGINLLSSGSSVDLVNSDMKSGASLSTTAISVNKTNSSGLGSFSIGGSATSANLGDAAYTKVGGGGTNSTFTIDLDSDLANYTPGTYTLSSNGNNLTLTGTFKGLAQSQTVTIKDMVGNATGGMDLAFNTKIDFSNFGISLNINSTVGAGKTYLGQNMASSIIAKSTSIIVDGKQGSISNLSLSGTAPGTYTFSYSGTGPLSTLGLPAGLASGISPGTGGTAAVALTGGSGTTAGRAIFTYDSAGSVTGMSVVGSGGAGYKAGDVLSTGTATLEANTFTFGALAANDTVTLAGLTFTAGSSGATAAQVASAFGGLDDGAAFNGAAISAKALGTATGGTFTSGTLSGWSTAASSGASTTFVATATGAQTDLSATSISALNSPTVAHTTPGATNVYEVNTFTFKDLLAGQAVTINGMTVTNSSSATVSAANVAIAFGGIGASDTQATIIGAHGASGVLGLVYTGDWGNTWASAAASTATVAMTRNTYSVTTSATLSATTAFSGSTTMTKLDGGTAITGMSGINVKSLSSYDSNNLVLTGTVNGVSTTQSLGLVDNAANTTQSLKFDSFGVSLDLTSFQAQSKHELGAALASLNTGSSTSIFGTGNGIPGQLIVSQGNNSALKFQSGPNSDAFIQIDTINVQTGLNGTYAGNAIEMTTLGQRITASGSGNLGYLGINDTVDAWQTAFKNSAAAVDNALEYISTQRAVYGSQMNRLSYISTNLQAQSTNLQNSRSSIIDTDFAAETARLTKGQIMQQAATAMLAQANQMPNVILSLLK